MAELRSELVKLEDQIDGVSKELAEMAKREDSSRRLLTVPGIGPLVATALTAAIGNGAGFAKARDLPAWLGLVKIAQECRYRKPLHHRRFACNQATDHTFTLRSRPDRAFLYKMYFPENCICRGCSSKALEKNERRIVRYTHSMSFHGAPTRLVMVVSCKGCQRPVPAGIRSIPDNAVAVLCPLCQEHRRYLPSEVYQGRIAFEVIRGGRR